MESCFAIHLLDEMADTSPRYGEVVEFKQIGFLVLERLD
jgi:hypothetical protein